MKAVARGFLGVEAHHVASEGFFRLMNEVPTVLMIAIVVLVVVRPF